MDGPEFILGALFNHKHSQLSVRLMKFEVQKCMASSDSAAAVKSATTGNERAIRIVKVFRILRIIKILKLAKFVT
jgi:hypothetical protein